MQELANWRERAKELDVAVIFGNPGIGRDGYYDHTTRLITIGELEYPKWRLYTIWHELGHAHHNHTHTNPSNERLADEYAARHLISPEEYAAAEKINPDARAISWEIQAPKILVEAFQRILTKTNQADSYPLGIRKTRGCLTEEPSPSLMGVKPLPNYRRVG